MGFFDLFKVKQYKQTIAELTAKNAELDALLTPEMRDVIALGERIKSLNDEIASKEKSLEDVNYKIGDCGQKLGDINAEIEKRIGESKQKVEDARARQQAEADASIAESNRMIAALREQIAAIEEKSVQTEKQVNTNENKIVKLKEQYRAVVYAMDMFRAGTASAETVRDPSVYMDEMYPSVTLHIHSMDVRELNKAMRDNDKQIESVTEAYAGRYTTKANQAIYKLMVIALRAELQNVLYDLKYQKLEQGVANIQTITAKYLSIACDGNQSIAPTMTKFIGETEYLFINAVKIEYQYYVRKEQARQEQIAIREQMKQEAAERKALEQERKKIEVEESKYQSQIDEMKQKLASAAEADSVALQSRILELESQLSAVVLKKEDIVNLQNGKAGNVYIISNLGSFGEDVFKIGMTRRLDPQERIEELGSASVPFEFDVHSFIFSDDAVSLENALHERLNARRVNKVNTRKEFFHATIDELEQLTNEIAPTAEFHRTMVAEEYRQSLSMDAPVEFVPDSSDEEAAS